ncbi:DegT/DnrJ/EryC1/StrS aminotransferase family protein [Glycomyces harbinensis]|uniref:DegT/DnrJ/EryC1/StrS aminotransferase family protein n=1 Tax=Glycomyces harbinensis TaxID=58114 RepID=A0A1G7DUY2_9ACTN|nr:DegT/DnrJ/EryC1/StrS aminotransferase family protein [Glycomyces harbinensis]
MWGTPAQVAQLRDLADQHGLKLFEDGSHAHGATVSGRRVGSFGDAAAFSMNGPKPLSAGEGGFLLTDDAEVYHRALLHGQYNKRCRNEIPETYPLHRYAVTGMGLKHRIHPLAAAIGLNQLSNLDTYLAGRHRIADYLCERLRDVPGVEPIVPAQSDRSSWYGLILRYRPEQLDGPARPLLRRPTSGRCDRGRQARFDLPAEPPAALPRTRPALPCPLTPLRLCSRAVPQS